MEQLEEIDLAISADEAFPDAILAEFTESLELLPLRFKSERRRTTPYASIEWLVPTLVVLFFSRKLFDAFMTEAGKDLYKAVKRCVVRLAARTSGPNAKVKAQYVVSLASPYKVSRSAPPVLSGYAILSDGRQVRFTFAAKLTSGDNETAVGAMLALLQDHYVSGEGLDKLGVSLDDAVQGWGTLPLIFDPSTQMWRAITKTDLRGDV